jgi:putative oxidoreductase
MSARKPIELGIDWLLRLGLGALFIVAAVGKLADPGKFAVEIADYRFLPLLAPYLAVMLPGVELVLGVAIVAGPRSWRKGAALGMMLLLAVFTVAVTQVVLRGINVDCGCFGGKSGSVTSLTIVRDVALFAAALFSCYVAGPVDPAPATVSAP